MSDPEAHHDTFALDLENIPLSIILIHIAMPIPLEQEWRDHHSHLKFISHMHMLDKLDIVSMSFDAVNKIASMPSNVSVADIWKKEKELSRRKILSIILAFYLW